MDDVTVVHKTESVDDLAYETSRLRLAVPARRNVRCQRPVGGVARHLVDGVRRLEHVVHLQLIGERIRTTFTTNLLAFSFEVSFLGSTSLD